MFNSSFKENSFHTLIELGKTQNYLTHQQIKDKLSSITSDNTLFETFAKMLDCMCIKVFENEPTEEQLLLLNCDITSEGLDEVLSEIDRDTVRYSY